jgi:hypothetical protein
VVVLREVDQRRRAHQRDPAEPARPEHGASVEPRP